MHRCVAVIAVIIAALVAFTRASAAVAAPPTARLGMNLDGPADWNSELPFVDEFRLSRRWASQKPGAGWDKGPPLHLDAQGWVTQLDPGCYAETPMCTGLIDHYPAGRWTVLYDGKGELTFTGACKACQVISQQPGKIVLQVDPARSGLFMQIRKTDPADYIRNIRVIMPGFASMYATQIFRPGFLKMWQGIGCFRFMDWMETDNAKLEMKTWADRPKMDDATYTARGVPLPIMIELCNREHADAWFSMPTEADDDYIRHFAAEVKAKLDPSLKVYIEYSNEVWNGQFAQHRYAQEQGQKLHLGEASRPWEGACLYYVRRSLEIFDIWQQVLGDQAKTRLVRVLAWQAASSRYWLDGLLLAHTRPGQVDALAIAPYMTFLVPEKANHAGDLTADQVAQWSVDRVLDHVQQVSLPQSIQWIKDAKQVADKYGVRLVAYEAGQHLVGVRGGENNEKLTRLFMQANAAPRMGQIYTAYYQAWQAAGGDLVNNFSSVGHWSKWGSWGLLQHGDDDPAQSPKFMAVMRWARGLGQDVYVPAERH